MARKTWDPGSGDNRYQGLSVRCVRYMLHLYFIQYTNNPKRGDKSIKQYVNYVGNNLKSLKLTVDSSLKKLRTDYIDILYVHFWDLHTSVEEIMDGLHNLVVAGKVLYLVCLSFLISTMNTNHDITSFWSIIGHFG